MATVTFRIEKATGLPIVIYRNLRITDGRTWLEGYTREEEHVSVNPEWLRTRCRKATTAAEQEAGMKLCQYGHSLPGGDGSPLKITVAVPRR